VNAVERFLAASRARNVEAATTELTANVVMHNPATDDPVVGRDSVAACLRAVEAACDEFRHTHLLTETPSEGRPLFGLVFEAKIEQSTLYGVDIIELDDDDRISSFTVLARPIASLMALGARMSEQGSSSR
jgi:hypothetical protein